jgi:hypothetical protein
MAEAGYPVEPYSNSSGMFPFGVRIHLPNGIEYLVY